MTISILSTSNTYTGNGALKAFAYTFAALDNSEVQVSINGTPLATNLYTVARNADNQGGTVTLLTAPANAAVVLVASNPSFTQATDFDNAGSFLPEAHELAFDRAVVRDLYLKNILTSGTLSGPQGIAATITVGSVTTLAAGSSATVTNVGTTGAAIFNFGLPAGATGSTGPAPNVTIGTVSTLSTGASATASITGTNPNYVLNLGLPTGATGSGSTVAWGGITGTLSSQTDLNTALNAKSPLASPTFTGTPAAPTATAGDSTTALATTAFVTTAMNLKAPLASPTFTGTPTAPTASAGTNTTQLATTAFVQSQGYATLAAPALTGAATIDGEKIGYRHVPILSRSASFTYAVADDGKGNYHTSTAHAATINPVGTTAYPVGTIMTGWVGVAAGGVTLTRGSGVSLYKNGSITSADVVVAAGGRYSLIQWATNIWTVDGTNLT